MQQSPLILIVLYKFIEIIFSSSGDPCIDVTDCDPYGTYICTLHKDWSEKCCREYCGFCHWHRETEQDKCVFYKTSLFIDHWKLKKTGNSEIHLFFSNQHAFKDSFTFTQEQY